MTLVRLGESLGSLAGGGGGATRRGVAWDGEGVDDVDEDFTLLTPPPASEPRPPKPLLMELVLTGAGGGADGGPDLAWA